VTAHSRAATATLAALSALAAVVLLVKGRGLTFSYDEWDWIVGRIHWRTDVLLTPHNGHLSLVPLLVFKVLFVTVGLKAYWVYRLLLVALHLTCVGLIFVYARRRVGPALAVAAASFVLFLGAAWNDLLIAFQISFLLPVAMGIAALLALDRRDRVHDALASLLLTIGVASSSLGLSFALGAGIELLATPARWRRIWVVLVPAALYLAWLVAYRNNPHNIQGTVGPLVPALKENLPGLPVYVATAVAGASAALLGLAVDWGRALVVGLVALLLWYLARGGVVTPRLAGLFAAALSYWALLAAIRGQISGPTESRYLYLGGVFVVLLLVEGAAGSSPGTVAPTIAALLVAGAAVGNYGPLRAASAQLRSYSQAVEAELGALELAGPGVNPNYRPDPGRMPNVTDGLYFAAVRAFGSPAATPSEIRRLPEPAREAADTVLAQRLGVEVVARPVEGGPPAVESAVGTVGASRGCSVFRPATPGASAAVTLPPGGLIFEPEGAASAEVRARYFGDAFPPGSIANVPPQASSLVRILPARRRLVWHALVTAAAPVLICAARPA